MTYQSEVSSTYSVRSTYCGHSREVVYLRSLVGFWLWVLSLNCLFIPAETLALDSLVDNQASDSELTGGSWGHGRKVFFGPSAMCWTCHAVDGQGRSVGPDLKHLVHRDIASVLRDINDPGSSIHSDYQTHSITLKDGRKLTGVVIQDGEHLQVTNAAGESIRIQVSEIESSAVEAGSMMPQGLLEDLSHDERRDLLAFLLTPPPSMPMDSPLDAPPVRTTEEVAAALQGSQALAEPVQPLHIVLIDGVKDHGPGEHDYPAWKRAWSELLAGAPGVKVTTAHEFPDEVQLKAADILVFFQKGSFSTKREIEFDRFLKRGGGAVFIHWAVNGADRVQEFAKRIGLASWGGRISYRHGPLTLEVPQRQHPIVRNFERLELYDESYWKLSGDLDQITVLATSQEDGQATPQLWVRDHHPGRVFVSIPGHYSWTLDDPLFRILLLRGIAWTADQPIDRFNELAIPGARMAR